MEVLWNEAPLTVREVIRRLPDSMSPAYTTTMTMLDRLYKKGFLTREREGHAFSYSPALTRDPYIRNRTKGLLLQLMAKGVTPTIDGIADVVAGLDETQFNSLKQALAALRRLLM